MIKFLDLNSQYLNIKPEIDSAIQEVIGNAAFIGGTHVSNFEESFLKYIGTDYCIGVGNGTDALEIAIEALNIPLGSEIIVPANSFIATGEAVTRSGHKVIFADVDADSYVISISDIKARITPKTKAIIAVHLYGHPCDMNELALIAQQFNLFIIEDCAQAHGAEYNEIRVGGIGDIAAFSFYPGKNLGAYGDGGAITTNSEQLAVRCRKIANHGRIAKYDHDFEGRNSRLDAIQAAVLNVKLKHLDKWIEKRIRVANIYLTELEGVGDIILPVKKNWAKQAYHLFVVRTNRRDELRSYLSNQDIQTGIHYPIALPKLNAYEYTGQKNDEMFANLSDTSLLSLPIGEHLSESEIGLVVRAIKEFFKD
ncbi:DegT/DnrJ/EryC1/StrS family aminotransferase [Gammaproteobacteria bacterium]|nr:DegT/DnrJ/EryC1/StrS family aminotransferase [Gammaproteobacteria bacterium]